ncbi:Uncharacterized protein APZ42_005036, partial [Daphnia magna]
MKKIQDDDDAGQLLQLHVGNQADIARPHNSGNTVDITRLSETADSDHNEVNSAVHVQLISSKEDILKELALLYVRKKLSLSVLGATAKLKVALGHKIPIDPIDYTPNH